MPQPTTTSIPITGTTRLYGVIAHPIAHVQAPAVFNPIFAEKGIDAVMLPIHITPDALPTILPTLAKLPNMGGVAVTIPHKMTAAALCQKLGNTAQASGAVNAIKFMADGSLHGDNFDGAGFIAGLIGEGHSIVDKSVLLLGAGGAARAIAVALVGAGIARLHIANRTQAKAQDLANLLQQQQPAASVTASSIAELSPAEVADFGLIINATSLGLNKTDALPIGLKGVAKSCIIADIIMQPDTTAWLQAASEKGLTIHKGRYMLTYQRDLIADFLGMY